MIDDLFGGRCRARNCKLFRHYFRRHPDPYMERQLYLVPHPDALSLRNAI